MSRENAEFHQPSELKPDHCPSPMTSSAPSSVSTRIFYYGTDGLYLKYQFVRVGGQTGIVLPGLAQDIGGATTAASGAVLGPGLLGMAYSSVVANGSGPV